MALRRSHIALIIALTYSVTVMGPLAPFAMRFGANAYALSGERCCDCRPEPDASRPCRCLEKELKHDHDPRPVVDCCNKGVVDVTPVLTCDCPCDEEDFSDLWHSDAFQQIPDRFRGVIIAFHVGEFSSIHEDQLTNRHAEPPDPPPKLPIIS